MRKLLMFICCGLLSSTAFAGVDVNTWLDRVEDRGAQIEVIRVTSEKPLVAIEETDAEIESILQEVEAIENESDENEKTE